MILTFIIALLLTLLIELSLAYALGYRRQEQLIPLTLINAITNPAANWFFILLAFYSIANVFSLLLIEIIIVLIEWKLILFSLEIKSKGALKLSIILNTASFLTGVLLYWL